MTSSAKPTFIFDFDGTLADSMKLTVKLFNQVANDYGLPQVKNSDLPWLQAMSAKELLLKYKLSPWRLTRLVTTLQNESKQHFAQVQPMPGVKEVLLKLQKMGITIGIVTSNSTDSVDIFLKEHHFPKFEFVHSEKNLFGKGKVLKKVVKKYNLDLNSTWYLGDEVRDIEAAHQANLPIISVTWGFNSRKRIQQAEPEFIVSKPEEIIELAVTKLDPAHPAVSKSSPA